MPLELHEIFLILTSIFSTAAVFNLTLYFGFHKKLDYLFFAFYCAFHVFKVWLKTFEPSQLLIPWLGFTAYDMIYLSVIMGLLSLNIFLLHHYRIKQKRRFYLVSVITSMISFIFLPEPVFIYIGLGSALLISLKIKNKKKGLSIYLAGLMIYILLTALGHLGVLPFGYFIGTIGMILFMVISSGKELSHQTKVLAESKLRSSQLENQLLKKSIQPHFVLNAMTSLQELIEKEPKAASSFVEDLSNVFDVFARVSNEKLISIQEELDLVESFINIMSVRMGKTFTLSTQKLDHKLEIPPGVLITLIENGITHGFEQLQAGRFEIYSREENGVITLFIENDGNAPDEIKEGVGINYVRSRLEEAFGQNFLLEFISNSSGFQTKIQLSDG